MGHVLGGFIDSLVQGFENSRPGLTDEQLGAGGGPVQQFFRDRYETERPRLREAVQLEALALTPGQGEALYREIDRHVERVLIPSYARHALRFTPRERADFSLLPEPLRSGERLAWGLAGLLLGAFVVAAPFIPLWSKWWVAVFAAGGLYVPNLRRYFALRRYEKDLNQLVVRAEQEIERLDRAYLATTPIEIEPALPAADSEAQE